MAQDGDVARVVDLLDRYGEAKFGARWTPASADLYLGARDAAELRRLLADRGRSPEPGSVVALLTRFAEAKFGDAWWPGNAHRYVGHGDGSELRSRLGSPAFA